MNPFESFDFDTAEKAFAALKTNLDAVASNRKFMAGDDWQGGAGWVGPQFSGNNKMSREIKEAIEREFTSKSSIRAAARRHQRGVIGRIPNWLVSQRKAPRTAPDGEKGAINPLADEAQEILNEFWKNSRVHRTLKGFVNDYLSIGHGILRLFFVQSGSTQVNEASTIAEAVKLIHLFHETPESGVVIVDKATLKRASLFRYEAQGFTVIEMCYVNDAGRTVFKQFKKAGSAKDFAKDNFKTLSEYISDTPATENGDLTLPLNAKLLVFEISGEPFITPAMRSQQKLVNKGFTMMSHNLDLSGFRERVYLNAQPPGSVQIDATAPGGKRFVPDENGIQTGAGKVQYTAGLEVTERDPDGKLKTTLTTPSIFESEPIDVTTYVDTIAAGSEAILEEADQKHISISGDAVASGESRKEARDVYKSSLENTKSELDDVMSEVFEAVLSIVAYLMGNEGKYDELQVTFNSILNPGPVSADDRRVAMEEEEKGLRSLESAMEEAGITDPDAMKSKIRDESDDIARLDRVLGVLAKGSGKIPLSLQIKLLARALNMTESEAAELQNEVKAEQEALKEERKALREGAGNKAKTKGLTLA